MYNRKRHASPGEEECEVCHTPLPEMDYYPSKKHFTCENSECRRAVHAGDRTLIVVQSGERKCDREGCTEFARAGSFYPNRRFFYCSERCEKKAGLKAGSVEVPCLVCGKLVERPPCRAEKPTYCGQDHFGQHLRTQNMSTRAGRFIAILNEYLSTFCPGHYKPASIRSVRSDLLLFFDYLNAQGIRSLNKVDPKLITRFIAWSNTRGSTPNRAVRFLVIFFNWMIVEGRRTKSNPIIAGFHKQTCGKHAARPYSQDDLALIWKVLEERGDTQAKLAIAIGQESGVRIGELARLRVQDVDLRGQQLFIRLPNKTETERWVPFAEKTRTYLEMWLAERDPTCGHDSLFYNSLKKPAKIMQLQDRFNAIFCKKSKHHTYEVGLERFSYHRMRHTAASNLSNAGADVSTIMAVGGWKSFDSMQTYVRLQKGTVRRDFDRAMQRIKESADEGASMTESLEEFARKNSTPSAKPLDSAA